MFSKHTDCKRNLFARHRVRPIHWAVAFSFAAITCAPSAMATTSTSAGWVAQSLAITVTTQAGDQRNVEKVLELTPEKADAFFELLAPNTVKVLVGRRNQGVHIRGTAKEAATLDALAELMMRESGREVANVEEFIRELEASWDSESIYELPKDAGAALLKVLAFEDVPVLVANMPNGIGVRATKRDQAVIADVARIMQGLEPQAMHTVPDRKVAKADDKPDRREGRGDRRDRPDRGERANRGDGGNRGEEARRGEDGRRRAREMDERYKELEERVEKLEALAAALHEGGMPHDANHAHAHGAKAHDEHGHADAKPKKQHDKKNQEKQIANKKGAKQKKGKGNKPNEDPNEVITMRYELPAHHAEHLFNLFAPGDITDILVSRAGNTVEVRAARKHQRTIKQLVKMLSPKSKAEMAKGPKA